MQGTSDPEIVALIGEQRHCHAPVSVNAISLRCANPSPLAAALLGELLGIVDVPAQIAKHRLHEIHAELRFVVVPRFDLVDLAVEVLVQPVDRRALI